MFNLRNYQIEAVEAIRSNYRNGIRRQIVSLPTGSGKSVIFGALIAQAIEANPSLRALVLAFACDLLTNARDKIKMIAPDLDIGILGGEHREVDSQIVVSTVQSARQPDVLRLLQAQCFSIVICDEAHHFAAETAREIIDALGFSKEGCAKEGRLLCGFSATPFRQDERGLGEVFDKIVYSQTIKDLIEEGYLTPPRGHRIATDIDLSSVSIGRDGDFSTASLSKVMNCDAVNQLVVERYLEKAPTQKTIAFTTSIAHAVALSEWFKKFGVKAEPIHSQLSFAERMDLMRRYQEEDLEVLVNPLLLTEGIDLPCTSCVVIARPTQSVGLFQQMVGRGLRLYPNKKECIVLDFGAKEHKLCMISTLLQSDTIETSECHQKDVKMTEIANRLPANINPRLKSAILDIDLLSDSFLWKKDPMDGCYYLKAAGESILKIVKKKNDRYDLVFFNAKSARTIATDLDFQYAFGVAEDFSKRNRQSFVVSDLDAPWRQLPISERQKEILQSFGFKNGIDELTRGLASDIIGSGVLRRGKKIYGR